MLSNVCISKVSNRKIAGVTINIFAFGSNKADKNFTRAKEFGKQTSTFFLKVFRKRLPIRPKSPQKKYLCLILKNISRIFWISKQKSPEDNR